MPENSELATARAAEPQFAAVAAWIQHPANIVSFRDVSTVAATLPVASSENPGQDFSQHPLALFDFGVTTSEGETSLEDFLHTTSTNGFAVLVGNTIAFHYSAPGVTREATHLLMSVSKSLTGLLAGTSVRDHQLDLSAPVTDYVPELDGSAFASATVQDLLDMAVSVEYSMDPLNGAPEMMQHDRVAGWQETQPGDPEDIRGFLTSLRPGPNSGRTFQYCSATSDVLAWVLERAAGKPFRELLSEEFWSQIDSRDDAMVCVDASEVPYASAGMCATMVDLLRVGRLILDGGVAADHEVVPASWLRSTFDSGVETSAGIALAGPLSDAHPGAFYRNQWWHLGDGTSYASGLGGQYLWLSPHHDIAIAKFSGGSLSYGPQMLIDHLAVFEQIASAVSAQFSPSPIKFSS